jgi:CRP-like cAMP-binding protein
MSRDTGSLGKIYRDGEVIVRQGQEGDCMYVIQKGKVEVMIERDGREMRLAVLGENDFFGEMAIFTRELRGATVRALGSARLLTVDKKTFFRRIQQDPSLAFRMVETMSYRIQEMNKEVARMRAAAEAARDLSE